jgi:hypothetical protein
MGLSPTSRGLAYALFTMSERKLASSTISRFAFIQNRFAFTLTRR